MAWIIRACGLVLAMAATAAVMLVLPISEHHGITPIHTTRIDAALFGSGYFLLFFGIELVVVEWAIVILGRPSFRRRDARLPIARVVR